MLQFIRSKKILLILGVFLVGLILFLIIKNQIYFSKYILVKDEDDVILEVNSDFFFTTDGMQESEYVKTLSESFIMGYLYLASLSPSEVIFVSNLTDEQLALLTYFTISSGKDSVCFQKGFFEEMVTNYFGREDFRFRQSSDGLEYRPIMGRYCFEHQFFDYVSRFDLQEYSVMDDYVVLSYEEIFDEENSINNRNWTVQFQKRNNLYQLVSVYAVYS